MTNKCDHCKYLSFPEYKSDYSVCEVFGEEPPEEYWAEDGCNCSEELLKQLLDWNERAIEKDHEAFVEWFLKENDNGNNSV